MAVNDQDFIGKALALLRDGLKPFVEREGTGIYGDHWCSEVQKVLRGTRLGSQNLDPTQDVAAQLVLMDRLWGSIFGNKLGRAERSLVNELLDVRNRWAHQSSFSAEDADRALDSTWRLLAAVCAPQAEEVRRIRLGSRRSLLGGSSLSEQHASNVTSIGVSPDGRKVESTNRSRILEFLVQHPGRDDDEIAAALEIYPRQTVNQICRMLREEHVLRRERGRRGKLVNFLIAKAGPVMGHAMISRPDSVSNLMSEDQIKSALESMLKLNGWSVKVAWGRQRGVDIEALRAGQRWIIECKGEGSLAPMQNNYFVGVIGELMQRMNDANAKHSIAFPDRPKFRRLWLELPATVKERLKLSALFVSDVGNVDELST